MNAFENYGIIIRELRKLQVLCVRKCAEKIGRSIGWLSEIENGKGTAQLTKVEFDRIIECLEGSKYRPTFKSWVANQKNQERIDRTFDGAVLKFIRLKKGMSLHRAASLVGISISKLCRLENGVAVVSLNLRNQIMTAYGYNPTSFKNFVADPFQSKVVPAEYKFEILRKLLNAEQLDHIYRGALLEHSRIYFLPPPPCPLLSKIKCPQAQPLFRELFFLFPPLKTRALGLESFFNAFNAFSVFRS